MKYRGLYLSIALTLAAIGCGQNKTETAVNIPPGISWASLLAESTDLSNLARPISPTVRAKMFSSSADPRKIMLANLAPEIIGDMDHGFFTEVFTNRSGTNAVLAEFSGPGVVTWVWSANPVGTLGLYVDGQEQPALSLPFAEFLAGSFLPIQDPFARITSQGHNLNFPIIHAKSCKLVVTAPRRADLSTLYYQVMWQSLPPDAEIHPFDVANIKQGSDTLKVFARRLLADSHSNKANEHNRTNFFRMECSIEPGHSLEVFQAGGPQAISGLRFTGKSKSDLIGLWLKGNWDGQAAVELPLHMLAGVSPDLENTASLPATVDETQVSLRWFMPFSKQGRIVCTNATDHLCQFAMEVWTQPIGASNYPLHFHANYQVNRKLRQDAGNIVTLADVRGAGRFVGCVLSVNSRSEQWWGEGDNIVWLDGTNQPALHGTGTEDYFGFAWCSPDVFNHPFRGQTKVVNDRNHRFSSMHRYHILDQLPFHQWGRFQFQALGLGKADMDWTTTVIWYEAGEENLSQN